MMQPSVEIKSTGDDCKELGCMACVRNVWRRRSPSDRAHVVLAAEALND